MKARKKYYKHRSRGLSTRMGGPVKTLSMELAQDDEGPAQSSSNRMSLEDEKEAAL